MWLVARWDELHGWFWVLKWREVVSCQVMSSKILMHINAMYIMWCDVDVVSRVAMWCALLRSNVKRCTGMGWDVINVVVPCGFTTTYYEVLLSTTTNYYCKELLHTTKYYSDLLRTKALLRRQSTTNYSMDLHVAQFDSTLIFWIYIYIVHSCNAWNVSSTASKTQCQQQFMLDRSHNTWNVRSPVH